MNQQRVESVMFGAVGLGTEGGTKPYELTVCFEGKTKVPAGKSGYSVGVMQTDFGQRGGEPDPLTPGMTIAQGYYSAANEWAIAKGRPALEVDTLRKLQTFGAHWESLPKQEWETLKEFGKSPEGKAYIASHLDKPLLKEHRGQIEPLMSKPAFSNWTEAEQLNAVAALGKMRNQHPTSFNKMVEHLGKQGSDYTPTDFRDKIQAVENAGPHYLAFVKAYDIAKAVTPLYTHEASAKVMDKAGEKIQSKNFNPASFETDAQLDFMKRVYKEPAYLEKTIKAVESGQTLPEAQNRPAHVKAFETQPPAKALAMFPKELAGAVQTLDAAQHYAKQFPLSQRADIVNEVKSQLVEHLCKKGPIPVPHHQPERPHTPSPVLAQSQSPRHDLAPKF